MSETADAATRTALMERLEERKAKNKGREHVNNAHAYAGSPMVYYCRECDHSMVLPESHLCAAPRYCSPCHRLIDLGLISG
jgi:hypothetical protein